MPRFNFFYTFLLMGAVMMVVESTTTSCASRSNPSGGPKDTLAPVLDTAYPANFSTRFTSTAIELVFNEYLNLKSPGQQIMVSPLPETKPEITLKGKRIFIELQDSLLPNTTYTISFGTAITDFTEGNVNRNFKYVFSTGTYIDSLSLEGMVYNAYTNEPEKDMLVALYETGADTLPADSLPFLKTPNYYAYLDEEGHFRMENLKASRYRLLAFEDQRGDFKLHTGKERLAFLDTTIQLTDSTGSFLLKSFTPRADYTFYGARHISKGLIRFNFSRPVPDITITRLFGEEKNDSVLYRFNTAKDTLNYWFTEEADSMVFLVEGYTIQDTSRLFLREYEPPALTVRVQQKELRLTDTLFLKSNLPLYSIDTGRFRAFSAKDTFTVAAGLHRDSLQVYVIPAQRPKNFTLELEEKAIAGWFGSGNDSAQWVFTSLSREDLGNLDFQIRGDSSTSYLLEIYNPQKEKALSASFTGDTLVTLRNYRPGKYEAQLIVDQNQDGQWTPGDLWAGRQPERVIHYSEGITIRANWDLELEWVIKPGSGKRPGPLKKKTVPGNGAPDPFE